MAIETDLLGDPISDVVDRRGRPQHQVTDKKRKYVLACVALNWTHEQIANAVGITPPTLRKHYLRELNGGKSMIRAKAFVKLQELVDQGDLKAIKTALHEFEKADLGPIQTMRGRKPPKLGKKEQAQLDAARADTDSTIGELMSARMSGEAVH